MSLSRTLDQVLNTSFSTHESAFPLLDVQSTFQTVTEKHCLMDFLPQSLKCFISKQVFWRRKWQPTPVFLLGESHGQRSLVGYSPWAAKSWTRLSDFTFFHFCRKKLCPRRKNSTGPNTTRLFNITSFPLPLFQLIIF